MSQPPGQRADRCLQGPDRWRRSLDIILGRMIDAYGLDEAEAMVDAL